MASFGSPDGGSASFGSPDGGSASFRSPAAEVEAAAPEFERRRGDNRERYEELEKRQLLGAARALAEAFGGGTTLSASAAKQAVRGALGRAGEGAGLLEAMTAMKHLGFIWRPGPTPAWEPGIPSLMDYIREHVPES